MKTKIKIERTSRRGYQVGKMFFTKSGAKQIEQEVNEIFANL